MKDPTFLLFSFILFSLLERITCLASKSRKDFYLTIKVVQSFRIRGSLWRSGVLTSLISQEAEHHQSNGFSKRTYAQVPSLSEAEAAFWKCTPSGIEDKFLFLRNQIYILANEGLANPSKTHTKNEGASVRNKFQSYELFGVYQKAAPSVTSKLTARIPREVSQGRKKGRKKGNWLVILATMVLRYQSTSYDLFRCSRRDCHCVCITPGLSRVIGAFGPGVCTLAVYRTRD